MDYQSGLNEQQYQAVTAHDQYLRIIAGAGSGKTRVITFRIAYLIEKLHYYPSQILAITFTNKAAEEIKLRVQTMLNDTNLNLRIATFHSFCARILRQEIKILNYPSTFTILDEDDQKRILKKILDEMNLDSKNLPIKTLIDYIDLKKNHWETPESCVKNATNSYEENKALIYQEYEKKLEKMFYLDFNDLILKTISIFQNNQDILKKWQSYLKHILVDEFQDVDDNQYQLLKLLAGKTSGITVVGDPDQTIYTWRGANIRIILDFDKDFVNVKTIHLEENYRSSANILKVANRLIKNNAQRLEKNLFTHSNDGEEIHFFHANSSNEEAQYVADNILSLYDGKNVFFKDFAVLYRSNSLSGDLEKVLVERGIPYQVYGSLRFYQRKEIKDLIAYLRLVFNFNDAEAFDRCIATPRRGIGEKTIAQLYALASTEDVSPFQCILNHQQDLTLHFPKKAAVTLSNFAKEIAKLHDRLLLEPKKADVLFYDYLKDNGYIDELLVTEQDERIENIKTFIEQLNQYLKNDNANIQEFIQELALYSSQDDMRSEEQKDFVSLMTIHTAKGLEFDNVFVFGLIDGIFPSSRAIMEKVDGLEEERRICYVALTRARKRLFLTDSGGFNYTGVKYPSRFLKEIKENAQKSSFKIQNDSSRTFDPTSIRAGNIIQHQIFGEGIVLSEKDGLIDVIFHDPKVGRKKLVANHPLIKTKQ